jgi:antitoxin (DNA-binding transcriptional repressor) of toxin-antitoxin stability system
VRKTPISVTEAARNFADCVNRVRYQKATFVLTKNNTSVAELAPSADKICTGRDLAAVLDKVKLSAEEAEAWSRDMREAREKLLPPRDKWE